MCLKIIKEHKISMKCKKIESFTGPMSFKTTSLIAWRAPYLIRSFVRVSEFLTKLPRAPAAFALVFSYKK